MCVFAPFKIFKGENIVLTVKTEQLERSNVLLFKNGKRLIASGIKKKKKWPVTKGSKSRVSQEDGGTC